MTRRNSLWAVAVLMLAGAMLVACGGGGEPVAPTPTPTGAPAATATPSARDHMQQGMAYVEKGKLDEAIAEFKAAIELEPANASARRNLSSAYGYQGRWAGAAAAYEKAIELAPNFGEAYGDLAWSYFELDKLVEAIAAGEKAIKLAPKYARAYNNLGQAYARQDRLDEAIAQFKQALELDPKSAQTCNNLGTIYLRQGQLDEAITLYQKAIQLDPNFAMAYYNLGVTYYQQGQLDQAVTHYLKAIQLNPADPLFQLDLAKAYRDQGKSTEAIAAYESYLRLLPAAPDKAAVEQEIARLKEPPAKGTAAEYCNAASGYSLHYPDGWYYEEDKAQVMFAESKQALGSAPKDTPLVVFMAESVSKIAQELNLKDITDPKVALSPMAQEIKAEMSKVETGKIAGYPAALVSVAGTYHGTAYQGGIAVVLVEGTAVYGVAVVPPDQWTAFRHTYLEMVNNLSFSLPGYRNAAGGYRLRLPEGWAYKESKARVTLALGEQALEASMEAALKEGPLLAVDASPRIKLAADLDVKDSATPTAFVQAMAALLGARVDKVDTGKTDGNPSAYANLSGEYKGVPWADENWL